jgi:hypothetical protein
MKSLLKYAGRRLTQNFLTSPVAALLVISVCFVSCRKAPERKQISFRSFETVFKKLRDINLDGIDPHNAAAFARDGKGNIYIADSHQRAVKEFDVQGHLVRTIGKMGWEPGNFIVPWSLACDNNDNLYVLDVQTGRISTFDPSGNFKSSIVFSSLGFAGILLRLNPAGDVFVGGLQRPPQPQSPLLYKLGNEGRLLASFYPQDSLVAKLNLSVVGGVQADLDSSGDIYAVQPVSTKVSVFSADGQLVREFGRTPSFYDPPVKLPSKLPKDRNEVQSLLNQWTQVSDIQVLRPEHLVVLTFNVHAPIPYGIELYQEDGKFLMGEIGSTLLPAFTNAGGHIYFYDPAASKLTLSEFSLIASVEKGSS